MIRGDRINVLIIFFPKNRYRTRAKEHRLPIDNENKEEAKANTKLSLKLWMKPSRLKICINHRSDKPLGGNTRSGVELNEVTAKMISGRVIEMTVTKQIVLNNISRKLDLCFWVGYLTSTEPLL